MKYLVRCEVIYSSVIEADSEQDAIDKAPAPPLEGEWAQASDADYSAEVDSE